MKEVTLLKVNSQKVLAEGTATFYRQYNYSIHDDVINNKIVTLPDGKEEMVTIIVDPCEVDVSLCRIYTFSKYHQNKHETIYLAVDPQLDEVLNCYFAERTSAKYKETFSKQKRTIDTLRLNESNREREIDSLNNIKNSYGDRILSFNRKPLLKRLWAAFKGRI
jgi:hypothetical protein